jgi:hypothetical protein
MTGAFDTVVVVGAERTGGGAGVTLTAVFVTVAGVLGTVVSVTFDALT